MAGEPRAGLAEIRQFAAEALARAEATSDTDVGQVSALSSGHPAAKNYGLGVRDGVVMGLQQVIAKIDEMGAGSETCHHPNWIGHADGSTSCARCGADTSEMEAMGG